MLFYKGPTHVPSLRYLCDRPESRTQRVLGKKLRASRQQTSGDLTKPPKNMGKMWEKYGRWMEIIGKSKEVDGNLEKSIRGHPQTKWYPDVFE